MKKAKLLIATLCMSATMAMTSFAGQWQQDSIGWWYQNDDGSYPANTWQWIDGNRDGLAESYYFDSNGYCLMNNTAPDGSAVDSSGAWIINGVVQTIEVGQATAQPPAQPQQTSTESSSSSSVQEIQSTVWIPATGDKYHSIPNCGRMNPDKATQLCLDDALSRGYTPCSKCF